MVSFRLVLISSIVLLSSCTEQVKQSYTINDGDTFTQSVEGIEQSSVSYELAYLDAPEREQPYGREAKQYLKDVLLSEKVIIKKITDSTVELFVNGQSINLAMVSKGYAWASLKIADPAIAKQYTDAQKRATDSLQGIWGLGHGLMIAPWQWRQQGQEKAPSMNYQQQMMLKRRQEQQAQKEAMIKRQKEYAKRRMLQQQQKNESIKNANMNKD